MRYTVFIKFNSTGKIQVTDNEIIVAIKSMPQLGKANRQLIQKLANYFGLPKDAIDIISGMASTKKLVDIPD